MDGLETYLTRSQADMVVGIVNWVKAHPTASSDEVAAEISRQVAAVLLKAH